MYLPSWPNLTLIFGTSRMDRKGRGIGELHPPDTESCCRQGNPRSHALRERTGATLRVAWAAERPGRHSHAGAWERDEECRRGQGPLGAVRRWV